MGEYPMEGVCMRSDLYFLNRNRDRCQNRNVRTEDAIPIDISGAGRAEHSEAQHANWSHMYIHSAQGIQDTDKPISN